MALLVLRSCRDASLLSSPKAKSVLLLYSSDHQAHNSISPSNVPFINSPLILYSSQQLGKAPLNTVRHQGGNLEREAKNSGYSIFYFPYFDYTPSLAFHREKYIIFILKLTVFCLIIFNHLF